MLRVIKTLSGYSCAHRHHAAASHCRFIHGYDRSFRLIIEGEPDPQTGWVIDFGTFTELDHQLRQQFDHTLVVAEDDPLLAQFKSLEAAGGCDLRVMKNPGMEGAAEWVYNAATDFVTRVTKNRARVVAVEARENDRNTVNYRPASTN